MKYYQFIEKISDKIVTYYVPMSKEHRDMIASLIESTDEFDSPYTISEEPGDDVTIDFYRNLLNGMGIEIHTCNPLSKRFIELLEEGTINITEYDPFYNGFCWDKNNV